MNDDGHNSSGGEPQMVACRVYTHGRRHPIVIGNIQGLRIPPITPAQLGILVGTFGLLVVTQPIWARFGSMGNAMALILAPIGLAWAARAVRLEGRAPWRAALGWMTLWSAPRGGVRLGRPDRRRLPTRFRQPSWLAELHLRSSGR